MNMMKTETLKEYVGIHERVCVIDFLFHQIIYIMGKMSVNYNSQILKDDKNKIIDIMEHLKDIESDLDEKYSEFLENNEENIIVDSSDLSSPPVSYGGKFYFDDIGDLIDEEVERYVKLIIDRHKRFFES